MSIAAFLSLFSLSCWSLPLAVPYLLPNCDLFTHSMVARDIPCTYTLSLYWKTVETLRFCAGNYTCSGIDLCCSRRMVPAAINWNAEEAHWWGMGCRIGDEYWKLNEKQLWIWQISIIIWKVKSVFLVSFTLLVWGRVLWMQWLWGKLWKKEKGMLVWILIKMSKNALIGEEIIIII